MKKILFLNSSQEIHVFFILCLTDRGTKEYFELLKDEKHGMTLKNELSVENLIPLIEIRKATHAYTPDISLIGNLISNKYE